MFYPDPTYYILQIYNNEALVYVIRNKIKFIHYAGARGLKIGLRNLVIKMNLWYLNVIKNYKITL